MLRKFGLVAFGLAAFAAAVSALVAADDKKGEPKKEEKVPSIKDCMSFQGKDGLAMKVEKAAKAEKWEDAQKTSAELAKLGEALGKNTPPKNPEKKDDWAKASKHFAELTAAVDTAAKAKKGDDVSKAVETLLDKQTCMGCHPMFKPAKPK
jgi:hypothetical protein